MRFALDDGTTARRNDDEKTVRRLTLAANSAQVVLLPMLAGGLWWITASERLIGRDYRNRWGENAAPRPRERLDREPLRATAGTR